MGYVTFNYNFYADAVLVIDSIFFIVIDESYPQSLRVRLWITTSGTRGTIENIDLGIVGYFMTCRLFQ